MTELESARHGGATATLPEPPGEREKPRRGAFSLASVPVTRGTITHLDMDLTVLCNLDCDYCFKEKYNDHIDLSTARQAIIWLIHAAGDSPEISLVMIGGEPLLRFQVMKQLIPFAVRRAAQHGKRLYLSMTTNGTVVNDEILAFCKRWGIGFHTSIDGHPDVQDAHRKYKSGKGSAAVLAKNLPRILSVRPGTTARSTVMPDTAVEVYRSYQYFLELGYVDIALVPGAPGRWTDEANEEWRRQFERVGDDVIEKFRQGRYVKVKYIDCLSRARAEGRSEMPHPCGVGRGMALVDVNGDLWPCHRWNKQDPARWKLGSIYESGFVEEGRAPFYQKPARTSVAFDCATCVARPICAGGCPAENLEETTDIWKRHPNACVHDRITAAVADRVHRTLLSEQNELFLQTYYASAEASA